MTTPTEALAAALHERLDFELCLDPDNDHTMPLLYWSGLARDIEAALSSSGWSLVRTGHDPDFIERVRAAASIDDPTKALRVLAGLARENAVRQAVNLNRCEAVWENAVGNASIRCFSRAGHDGEHNW